MNKTPGFLLATLLVASSALVAGCRTHDVVVTELKPLPDSPTVEAQVTRLFSGDAGLRKFKIWVNTFQGNVMLDGVVDTEEQRQQATRLVWTVPGVRGVENDLFLSGEKQP